MKLISIVACLVLLSHTRMVAQSGKLDYSFSDNGLVLAKGAGIAQATGIAEQSDGKIVVVGTLTTLKDTRAMFIRYKADGSLDSSFGINGMDTFFLGNGIHGYICGLVIQPDDKILIAGDASFNSNDSGGTLIYRLTKNGLLDSSFNKNGIFYSHNFAGTNTIALQPNGKIVVNCQISTTKALYDIAVARLNTDGSMDTTFNHTGVSISSSIHQSISYGLKLLTDGKIVACGIYNTDTTLLVLPTWTGTITRFNADGTIDSSFGIDGIIHWPYRFIGDHAYFMNAEQQQNGKLLICGFDTSASFVIRFNDNGQIDSSFGKNGFAFTKPHSGGLAIAVQADDKINIGGSVNLSSIDFAVNQFTPNGALDSSFGKNKNGTAAAAFGIHPATGLAICLSKSRIYVAGKSDSAFAVAAFLRYNTVLPVNVLSFSAQQHNTSTLLQWQTASEVNTSYFNIQRSTDGVHFMTINKTTAAGNSASTKNYTYTDVNVAALHTAKLYYRLQEVDKDGKSTYSNIQVINFTGNNTLFSISPNPAKDHINITSSAAVSDAQITISNVNGRTLYSTKHSFANGEQLNVPVSSFANQTLFITVTTTNTKQEFKVVKE